jgi:hypothetical protein
VPRRIIAVRQQSRRKPCKLPPGRGPRQPEMLFLLSPRLLPRSKAVAQAKLSRLASAPREDAGINNERRVMKLQQAIILCGVCW